jgi:hypothetical protein
MAGRPWKAIELRRLARLYPRHEAAEIARRLERSARSVSYRAAKLGLRKIRRARVDDAFVAEVRRLHSEGRTDPEIAEAMDCERHLISRTRRPLGLPSTRGSYGFRPRVGQATREQCRRAGVPTLAEIRVLAFREKARRSGWPAELASREVDILDALAARGPMTRREIAAAIGANWVGSRSSLKCRRGR